MNVKRTKNKKSGENAKDRRKKKEAYRNTFFFFSLFFYFSRTVFVHFSTCSSARAEKTSAFSVMGKTTVDVATVKDAAKHTAVFIDNLFVEKENNPSFCCCVVVFFSSFPAAFVFVFIITRRCRFSVVGVFGNFLCALLENEEEVAALVLVASVVVVITIIDVLSV
jgi:hypothetical protein